MAEYDDLVRRAEADPTVLGVVLTGSHARGLATAHSDVDIVVVVARPGRGWGRPG